MNAKARRADMNRWRHLGRPKSKVQLLLAKLRNANGGLVSYRLLGGAPGDAAFQMLVTRARRACPQAVIVAERGVGLRLIEQKMEQAA